MTDWIPGRKQWPTAKLLTPEFRHELPLEEVTLAEALKPAGYVSATIGKWHLGGDGYSPREQGLDQSVGCAFRGSPKSYFGPFDLPGLEDGPRGEYLTDRLSLEAEKFIEANKDRRFFLYLPEFAVHIPLEGKKDLVAKYEAKLKSSDSVTAGERYPAHALTHGPEIDRQRTASVDRLERTDPVANTPQQESGIPGARRAERGS